MRKHECVTKMWLHVLQETANFFRGTTHEADWLVYHDALTHLTDKSTVAWMKTHTIDGRPTFDESAATYRRWLLPLKGLNDGCVSPGGGDCGGGSKPSSMPTTPLQQITNNRGGGKVMSTDNTGKFVNFHLFYYKVTRLVPNVYRAYPKRTVLLFVTYIKVPNSAKSKQLDLERL